MDGQQEERPLRRYDRLLAAARAGDLEARGQVVLRCRGALLRRAEAAQQAHPELLRMGGTPADVVQDTFVEAQRDFHQFRGQTRAELLAWLGGILRHQLAALRRRCRPQRRAVSLDRGPTSVRLRESLIDHRPRPDEVAIINEEVAAVSCVLEALPPEKREIVRLHVEENCPFVEVGRRMGCSEDTSRKNWNRLIQWFRRVIFHSPSVGGGPDNPDQPGTGGREGGEQ